MQQFVPENFLSCCIESFFKKDISFAIVFYKFIGFDYCHFGQFWTANARYISCPYRLSGDFILEIAPNKFGA